MSCCISFGKMDIKYLLLIILILVSLAVGALSFNLYKNNRGNYYPNYKENNKFLKSFLKYLGMTYFILGESIRKKFVYKKGEKPIKNLITIKDIIYLLIICFFVLLDEFFAIFLKIKTNKGISLDERYNSIEFIFLFIISLIIFKVRYYKHQYISILLIIILEIIRYIVKRTDNNNNDDEDEKNINPWVEFLLQISRALIDAIFAGYSKSLMEVKFFSPYKTTYIFGLICLIVIIITYIILTFISVESTSSSCFIKYKENCYIDNFFSIFSDFTFLQFLGILLYSIFMGNYQFAVIFIIKDYTICHLFLFYQISSLYSNIIESIKNKLVLSFIIIFYILEFFITFIFLELIQLNFWGLDQNIKINIEKRALTETYENYSSERDYLAYNDDDYVTKFNELKEQNEDNKQNEKNEEEKKIE